MWGEMGGGVGGGKVEQQQKKKTVNILNPSSNFVHSFILKAHEYETNILLPTWQV